jgi:hypothetical protein
LEAEAEGVVRSRFEIYKLQRSGIRLLRIKVHRPGRKRRLGRLSWFVGDLVDFTNIAVAGEDGPMVAEPKRRRIACGMPDDGFSKIKHHFLLDQRIFRIRQGKRANGTI